MWAAFLVGAWCLAYVLAGNELLIPSLSSCLKELGLFWVSGSFWRAVGSTMGRTFLAFLLSFVLSLVAAVAAYLLPWLRRFLTPIVAIFRSVPTLAAMLIILVWTGAAGAPIAVAFMALFPMLYTSFLAALMQVDGELLEMSRVYKVPLMQRITQMYLPLSAPYALRESGAACSFAVKLVVSAEVLAGTFGSLGGMMQDAKAFYEMPALFALVIVAFLIGLAIEGMFALFSSLVERRVK